MDWIKLVVEGEDGKPYTDFYSDDGHWWCAEGLDERDRKRGKPWLLMYRRKEKGSWDRVDTFKTIHQAKRFAEDL